ncbi:hypothetical protein L7F22_008295 [Adiantum nelumboides]|nr:hypothetical protein [Adiantum nelumboides]
MATHEEHSEEYLDVLNNLGQHTGIAKLRSEVHRDGDYHRAVHVWIYVESSGELLLQKRAESKDSWPGLWDVSSAGHISAGDTSLSSARRELEEELGVSLPLEAFELLFVYLQECVINDGTFINNEFNDVYVITTVERIPLDGFLLQESEVSGVKYIGLKEYEDVLRNNDPKYVPYEVDGAYSRLFTVLRGRYASDLSQRCLSIQKQMQRYAHVDIKAELSTIRSGDLQALLQIIQACQILEKIFLKQVWPTNLKLKDWLKKQQKESELSKLLYSYFLINKTPWSCLDENEAFMTTADSAICEAHAALKGPYKSIQYRAAFPSLKPAGANFYPPDMDRGEFELWIKDLNEADQAAAKGFHTVIRRRDHAHIGVDNSCHDLNNTSGLQIVPYSKEYCSELAIAAELLNSASQLADTPSLKRLLETKAKAFLSNEYYDSEVCWIKLDSAIDLTIGPYETYEDSLFGYKATFEAFVGIRDDVATFQVELFSHHLQNLENNLPMEEKYKSKGVKASPIRVMELIFNAGDVKGPQTLAFNLPNDERVVEKHGNAMVMMKNVSEAKFQWIVRPISQVCISQIQQKDVDFDAYFTHIICHECCHGLGPHAICLPSGKQTTVRLGFAESLQELQELNSSIEEAKADIVGLWALQFLIDQNLLPKKLESTMYVSFLAGCFRSIRFGLHEAHGKGQALQFNWILEKGGFELLQDGTFGVKFLKVKEAVESLCTVILTIQAEGDKEAARRLLDTYATISPCMEAALNRLQSVAVRVLLNLLMKAQIATCIFTVVGLLYSCYKLMPNCYKILKSKVVQW